MALRLCAIFASASACMLAFCVPQTRHKILPTAAPKVTSVVMLLVAHNLGRAHHGHWRRRLGGRRTARRWHGAALGGPRAACGGGGAAPSLDLAACGPSSRA